MRLLSMCLVKKTSGVGPRRARRCVSNIERLRSATDSPGPRLGLLPHHVHICRHRRHHAPFVVIPEGNLLLDSAESVEPRFFVVIPEGNLRLFLSLPVLKPPAHRLSPPLSTSHSGTGDSASSPAHPQSPASSSAHRNSSRPSLRLERIFHQPVLQAMEADQHQPPSRLQQRPRALQQRSNLPQLIIHSNPDCLKGPVAG